MNTVGIIACSDAQKPEWYGQNRELMVFLKHSGRNVLVSSCLYEKSGPFSGTGEERAAELMKMFANPDITDIYDVSGGDMANEVLDFLDFDIIRNSRATFWGYSDLTSVINAIYTMTGKTGVLYQIKNLVYPDFRDIQRRRYLGGQELFCPDIHMIQGKCLRGTVVGGNIRCFLKLAGTKYFPDVTGKVLLLESLSGRVPRMVACLSQLRSCGVFDRIAGILLGTFTEMTGCEPDIVSLVQRFAGKDMPIAKTHEIGHGHDAKAIRIGTEIDSIQKQEHVR